jgi:hypothetical protein
MAYDQTIAATADDGYEYGGSWYTNEVAAGDAGGGSDEVIGGLRFTGITIPDDAIITDAYIRVYKVNGSGSGTLHLRVRAVDDDDAAQFSSGSRPSGATLTTAYVDWDIAMSPLNEWAQSGDLSDIIQELVDSYGGLSSAAINFALRNNGSSSQYLYFEDYEAAGTNQAELVIEWTEAGTIIGAGGIASGQAFGTARVWNGIPDNCDMYFDWRAGSDGDPMTDARAEGGCWPASRPADPFVYPSSPASILSIETDAACPTAEGLIFCGGATHDLADVDQGMIYDHSTDDFEEIRLELPSAKSVVSIGFYYKTTLHLSLYAQYGESGIQGIADGDWSILSTYVDASGNAHSCLETNGALWPATPANAPTLAQDTWYWITIQYDADNLKAYLRAYLASTMAQVGSEVEADLVSGAPDVWCVDFGQVASEGNFENSRSWFGAAMVDWTNGIFPLLPFRAITPDGLASGEAHGTAKMRGTIQSEV